MDPDIEKLEVQIKAEVNYDELDYYVPEEAIVVSSEGYEEVVVSEDIIIQHKIEPVDPYYEANYAFQSPSKDSFYETTTTTYDENNNNYLYQQLREPQRNYTLKAKQLELMRVKKMGGKQKLVSGRSDGWVPGRAGLMEGGFSMDEASMADDDTEFKPPRKYYSSSRGYSNFSKPNKPRKRSFAHRYHHLVTCFFYITCVTYCMIIIVLS